MATRRLVDSLAKYWRWARVDGVGQAGEKKSRFRAEWRYLVLLNQVFQLHTGEDGNTAGEILQFGRY